MFQKIVVVFFSSLVILYSFRPAPSTHVISGKILYDVLTKPSTKSSTSVKSPPSIQVTPSYLSGQIQTDRIFIGNLPFTVTESAVRNIIGNHIGDGVVRDIKIASGQKTKRPLGFLFADFYDTEAAVKAVQLFDGYNLDGRILNSNLKYLDDSKLIKTATKGNEKVKTASLNSMKSSNTIYLSNLDYSLDEEEICNMCDDLVGYGLVHEVRIPLDKETGSPKGFAYIEFKHGESVPLAIQELSDVEVYGRILKVERMKAPKKKEVALTLEQQEEEIFKSLMY